jgi:glucokinase
VKILGIDLGGTSIKSGLVSPEGVVSQLRRTKTPNTDASGEQAIGVLAEIVKSYLDNQEIAVVGLCVPGIVDAQNGIAVFSGTLGWRNLPIAQKLQELVGIPVYLEHDVTASGYAEFKIGAAKGYDSAMIMAIGTALAACLVINGAIYRPHSAVGEIGHAPTRNDRPCVCGKTGCMEMTVSGGALVRNYKALSGKDATPDLILNAHKELDQIAKELRSEFYEALAFGIHFVASTLGPQAVVIAGGIADADPDFASSLEKELDKVLGIQLRPKILISKLEGTSGCIGAALSAMDRLKNS